MKLLFVSRDFSWPLRLGSSVHAGNITLRLPHRGRPLAVRLNTILHFLGIARHQDAGGDLL
ncbi:MAG: hypothetical protein ACKOAH_30940, partial [Pirellula sp.]